MITVTATIKCTFPSRRGVVSYVTKRVAGDFDTTLWQQKRKITLGVLLVQRGSGFPPVIHFLLQRTDNRFCDMTGHHIHSYI